MYKEMAFISYYFHWGADEVAGLSHVDRRRWCSEISSINKDLSPSKKDSREKSITEFGKSRF
ncbi:MAG: hypothetical protein K6E56_06335 [Lachnospiraceae bacterium]|nr:hypothetical protein [Lachnospiraceae bacterium]